MTEFIYLGKPTDAKWSWGSANPMSFRYAKNDNEIDNSVNCRKIYRIDINLKKWKNY